jgi:hypothetical protein
MSHPVHTIWRFTSTSHSEGPWDPVTRIWMRTPHHYEIFTVRGPGIRETRITSTMRSELLPPAWAQAQAYLIMRGADKSAIQLMDGQPPCIFCWTYRADHVPGFFGEHCRPSCHIEGCEKVTCVQALVGGFIPACLHHAFEGGHWKRAKGIDDAIVNPCVRLWRAEEELARQIALAARAA